MKRCTYPLRPRAGLTATTALLCSVLCKHYSGPLEEIVRGNVDDTFFVVATYGVTLLITGGRWQRQCLWGVVCLAMGVELLQYAGVLHPHRAPAAVYWLGASFDFGDCFAYLAGALICTGLNRTALRDTRDAAPDPLTCFSHTSS